MIKLTDLLNELQYEDLEKIQTWDDLKSVFSKYKHDLKYLSKYEGEDSNNLLGSGGTGKVFRIGNSNKAIKISNHTKDYYACKKLVGKDPKNLIKVYGVKKIKNSKSFVALIIMEYCDPLPTNIKKIIQDNDTDIEKFFYDTKNDSLSFKDQNIESQFRNIKKELIKYNILNYHPNYQHSTYTPDVRPSNFLINSLGNICFVDIIDPFI